MTDSMTTTSRSDRLAVVYVAGPFRGQNAWEVERHVRMAEAHAFRVAEMGAAFICPHTNSRFFDGTLSGGFWVDLTLELMRRADAVLVVDTVSISGGESAGVRGEIEEARRLGIPVFYCLRDLAGWIREGGLAGRSL